MTKKYLQNFRTIYKTSKATNIFGNQYSEQLFSCKSKAFKLICIL